MAVRVGRETALKETIMKMEVAAVRAEEKHRLEIKAVLHVEESRRKTAVADAKAAAESEYDMCIQVSPAIGSLVIPKMQKAPA